jgi:hypothetical protein
LILFPLKISKKILQFHFISLLFDELFVLYLYLSCGFIIAEKCQNLKTHNLCDSCATVGSMGSGLEIYQTIKVTLKDEQGKKYSHISSVKAYVENSMNTLKYLLNNNLFYLSIIVTLCFCQITKSFHWLVICANCIQSLTLKIW